MGLTKLYMACVEVLKEISVVKLGAVLKGIWVSGLLKHVRDSRLRGRNTGAKAEVLLRAPICPVGLTSFPGAFAVAVSGFVFSTLRG